MEYDEDYKKMVAEQRELRRLLKERKRREREVTIIHAVDTDANGEAWVSEAQQDLSSPDPLPPPDQELAPPPTRLPPVWAVKDAGATG